MNIISNRIGYQSREDSMDVVSVEDSKEYWLRQCRGTYLGQVVENVFDHPDLADRTKDQVIQEILRMRRIRDVTKDVKEIELK